MKIKMLKTVCPKQPDFPVLFSGVPVDTVLFYGDVYRAVRNKYGAVTGICANGKKLDVKPGEFEIVEK